MTSLRKAISAALALLFLGSPVEAQPAPTPLGLMGTIPIYWGEASEFGDFIGGTANMHWARAELEQQFELRPIAYLNQAALEELEYLLLAQPRALSGEENVALDAWVREGGQLLLFADPMMTGHSEFPLGDRRRPQDVVLLSPILDHWGLTLEFDEDQAAAPRLANGGGLALPVNLPGRFRLEGGGEECVLAAEDVVARCTIGQGRAMVIADAAMLDLHDPDARAVPALERLITLAFATSGEITGK